MITEEQLKKAFDYQTYKQLLESLLAQGRTTGHDQSETMLSYAKLNIQRMQRVEKTMQVDVAVKETLQKVSKPFIWLVITEGWCGDTAQIVPVLHILAQLNPKIEFRLLLRDDNPEVMGQYLTNGARSIPKLICLEKNGLKEKFVWGPRPAELQKMVQELMKEKVPVEEKGLMVQKWYNNDQTRAIQEEIKKLAEEHLIA